ncbi:HesB/IscA family protein [Polyangium aurulentum]|uniref:HesB/IscA family protein n=1 Tax=Polyangium aurulentum TaxID=2567896 RepID=UPI0010AE945F|nr:iron-sulfur cluster assembly accessory protein [Polyangium aurulentum]UQA62369.1 iron-sulfur cluster assembly accessory protein [Polyangium aurulentum]
MMSSSSETTQKAGTTETRKTLSVSQAAVDAIRANLAKRGTPEAAIRVGIRGGGCSGFSYVIEFDDKPPRSGDLVLEFAEEGKSTARVYCDKKSLLYLAGSVLDWEKTLMFQGFKFKNPQEASRCGCGHSFTVG